MVLADALAFDPRMADTARMSSSDMAMQRVRTRCVGGPKNGITYDLELSPDDTEALQAMRARGGTMLSDRYRLVEQRTTMGERILVYIGEPQEGQ
jgi:hypothetical protein